MGGGGGLGVSLAVPLDSPLLVSDKLSVGLAFNRRAFLSLWDVHSLDLYTWSIYTIPS